MKLNTHTKRTNNDDGYNPEWIIVYGIFGLAIWIVALAILW